MKGRNEKIHAFALELRPCAWGLAVGSDVLTLSHLGETAIENQETLPGDVSSHQIPPASLPDANSIGGGGLCPRNG